MTRDEHIAWAKGRALEFVEQGALGDAFASMASDLSKHDATRAHPAIPLGTRLLLAGQLSSPAQMRDFIEGFS